MQKDNLDSNKKSEKDDFDPVEVDTSDVKTLDLNNFKNYLKSKKEGKPFNYVPNENKSNVNVKKKEQGVIKKEKGEIKNKSGLLDSDKINAKKVDVSNIEINKLNEEKRMGVERKEEEERKKREEEKKVEEERKKVEIRRKEDENRMTEEKKRIEVVEKKKKAEEERKKVDFKKKEELIIKNKSGFLDSDKINAKKVSIDKIIRKPEVKNKNEKKVEVKKSEIKISEVKKLEVKKVGVKKLEKKSEIKNKNEKKVEVKKKVEKEPIKFHNNAKVTQKEIDESVENINKLKKEISKIVIGQEEIVDTLITGLICNGHVLLEGVPGIGKTLAIRALGQASGCSVKRVQFTVDLLPTDITGITTYTPEKGFEIVKGPIFANFIIADEINRSPPKTQSAMIEAMQEKQVTIGKRDFALPFPFFVMATKNPLESMGVYPLPEAQLDRFLFDVIMGYPKGDEEKKIMEDNISLNKFEDYFIRPVINPEDIVVMQELAKRIYLDDSIKSYILAIVEKTRDKTFKLTDCIAYGVSPRASISMFIASKARALLNGRGYVLPEDVKAIVGNVLRHRLLLSYKATIRNLTADDIIKVILNEVMVE